MKQFFLFTAMVLVFGQTAKAQNNYSSSISLRLGPTYGITYKQFISTPAALEFILQTRYYGSNYYNNNGHFNHGAHGFNLVGLYEHHGAIKGLDGLNWFVGGGVHVGFWQGYYNHPWFPENRAYFAMGIDAILGLEYTFKDAPISLALDWKPAYNLVGWSGFWGDEGALSLRYTFGR